MDKISQKVELTANILIICIAVLLATISIQNYFFSAPALANQKERIRPVIGSKLDVPDVNYTIQPKTLIFALKKGCRFCNESAAFYKRIIEHAQNKNIKLVAVFPGSIEEGTHYLNELGISQMEVKSSSLNNLQVSGTPTLIIINDKGEITDYWVGKLTTDKEIDVLNKL